MKKILVIRFSSIGDIVLTTPILRCIKSQHPEWQVHYLTKKNFAALVESNPNVDKVFAMDGEIDELIPALKDENYDHVVDLHNNLRTLRLKQKLKRPATAFPKLNYQKFLFTTFKINRMPDIHIVDRYFQAVTPLGIQNDQKGLDFFIPKKDKVQLADIGVPAKYIAFAIGAQFATKRLPEAQIIALIKKIDTTVVLLGGPGDSEAAERIISATPNAISLCGKLNLNQSASVVQQASKVISHDTGLMHIASAFKKPIVSIWGNTSPHLGMYPYMPGLTDQYSIHEVDGLKCRPCSKIGYQKCPKKHFKCMSNQDLDAIADRLGQ